MPDGTFTLSVNIGEKGGRGINVDFQIVVLALPKGKARQGLELPDLPAYGGASQIVTVRRSHK